MLNGTLEYAWVKTACKGVLSFRYHMIPFCSKYIFVFSVFWYQMIPKVSTPLSCIACHTRGGAAGLQMKGFKSIPSIFHIFFSVSCDTEAVWFFIRYKTYFFIFIWHGIETHVRFHFFLSCCFFGRFITVEGDRIIWQAMQDKALSTKRANCLYYRDLRVDKRAFLWTKCPRKF